DLKFFDDERLDMIIVGTDEKGEEICHLTELNYTNLNFLSIPGPQSVESMGISECLNAVDQVLDKMKNDNFTPFFVLRSQHLRIIPSQLTVNGVRDLVCVLNEDRKRIIMFDTNDKEEIEDEKNGDNEETNESSEMMEE
ncbi:14193_t:CDS:2, partial [Acaulospora morrowiae]